MCALVRCFYPAALGERRCKRKKVAKNNNALLSGELERRRVEERWDGIV